MAGVVLSVPEDVAAAVVGVAIVVVVSVSAVFVVPAVAASAATEVKEELDPLPPVPLCNADEDTVADEDDKAVVAEIFAPTVSRCFRVSDRGVVPAIDATASDVGDSLGRLVVTHPAILVLTLLPVVEAPPLVVERVEVVMYELPLLASVPVGNVVERFVGRMASDAASAPPPPLLLLLPPPPAPPPPAPPAPWLLWGLSRSGSSFGSVSGLL
uniref:Uncharacterized protein n=1 Tax=Anopheles culicifacies TaxID=139723 RepID=A0A182LT87_9DIPT